MNNTSEHPKAANQSSHRRRRRHERDPTPPDNLHPVRGYLWRQDTRAVVLVAAERRFVPERCSPVVPAELVEAWRLDAGLRITGVASADQHPRVHAIDTIEGLAPEEYRRRSRPFCDLVSIDPEERFRLETGVETRVAELVAPLGKGQRCLIVSPPKAGKTTLLQQMAHAIAVNHPTTTIFVLLVDERPEEVTDWTRSTVGGEVFASSSDQTVESHIQLSEMVLERARRLVELGEDVVIFMDSLTRLARAYNSAQRGSGRILSGGIDSRTMERPRRFFGSARNVEHGGSLTVVATCLVDTGSRMDEVIFQEFKGTGNMELVLSRKLFEKRIFPCIDIPQSGTRKEEKLYPSDQVEKLHLMRRALATLSPDSATELLVQKVREFPTNRDFLMSLQLR